MILDSHAKAGVTPDWHNVEVWFNGYKSDRCFVEVQADERWGIEYNMPFDGETRLVRGDFKLIASPA